MPLAITRRIKTGGSLVDADLVAATFDPKRVTLIRKMNSVLTPIPGEQHFGMPMGPEAVEFSVNFLWDQSNCPCPGRTFAQSLKQWTCNSIYAATPYGSLVNDIATAHYIAKTITYDRKAPGVKGVKNGSCTLYPVWNVTMNLMKLRDSDVTDCPTFTDYTISNSYSGSSLTPFLEMTNVLDDSDITVQPSTIKVAHTGQPQAFALYDEEALSILPPLGNVGPVIDIEFRASNADFELIKGWAATRTTVVSTDQCQYDEFDIDNAPSYYSRWIVSGYSWDRDVGSGGQYTATGKVTRRIAMSLTRYWGYELLEV